MTDEMKKLRDEAARVYREKYMRDDDLMTFADCRKSFKDGFDKCYEVMVEQAGKEFAAKHKFKNRPFYWQPSVHKEESYEITTKHWRPVK